MEILNLDFSWAGERTVSTRSNMIHFVGLLVLSMPYSGSIKGNSWLKICGPHCLSIAIANVRPISRCSLNDELRNTLLNMSFGNMALRFICLIL